MAVHRGVCFCGGIVVTDLPQGGLVDVYAVKLPTLDFAPAVHIHYGETVLPMKDGLPEFRDMPAEYGGSGEMVPE